VCAGEGVQRGMSCARVVVKRRRFPRQRGGGGGKIKPVTAQTGRLCRRRHVAVVASPIVESCLNEPLVYGQKASLLPFHAHVR